MFIPFHEDQNTDVSNPELRTKEKSIPVVARPHITAPNHSLTDHSPQPVLPLPPAPPHRLCANCRCHCCRTANYLSAPTAQNTGLLPLLPPPRQHQAQNTALCLGATGNRLYHQRKPLLLRTCCRRRCCLRRRYWHQGHSLTPFPSCYLVQLSVAPAKT